MNEFGRVAVVMGGRAGLGDAVRLGRVGARGRPRDMGATECGA